MQSGLIDILGRMWYNTEKGMNRGDRMSISKAISIGGCHSFCKHRHAQLKDGWLPTCDAYPNGNGENDLFDCTRECANGIGFKLDENADMRVFSFCRGKDSWNNCMRHYLQFGTPGECWRCHSDSIHVYSDAPLTTMINFVCYGCGERYTFDSDKNQYLNRRKLRYIGHNPLFPLTFGKIYECDWMEHGMYWIRDDKDEEYLYPLYVFEIL